MDASKKRPFLAAQSRFTWLFASGLVVGACAMPPEAEVFGGLPCDPSGACPGGYQCVAGKCVQPGSSVQGTGGSNASKEAGTPMGSGGALGNGGSGAGGSGTGGSGNGGHGVADAGAGGNVEIDASYRDASMDAALDGNSPEASVLDAGAGGAGAGGAGTGGIGSGGKGAGGIGAGGIGSGGKGAGGIGAGGAGTGGTGSGGYPGAGVVCGTITCAAGTHCCFPSSGTPTCSASACPAGTVSTIGCDGPEDCPSGNVCCHTASLGTETFACKTQCAVGDVTIECSNSLNCPAGDVCCAGVGFPLRSTGTTCQTACSGISYTGCTSDADCPGSSCVAAILLTGFRVCN